MQNNRKLMAAKITICCAGSFCVGISMACMSFGNAGADPVTSLIIGISKVAGITEGVASLLLNLLFFLLAMLFFRKCIGIATITSMLIIGPSMDLAARFLEIVFPQNIPYWGGLAFLAFGSGLLGVSVGVYLSTGMGSSPSDSMMLLVHQKFKLRYQYASWFVFAVCLICAALLGVFPRIGTFVTLFIVGSTCDFTIRLVNKKPGVLFQIPKQPDQL